MGIWYEPAQCHVEACEGDMRFVYNEGLWDLWDTKYAVCAHDWLSTVRNLALAGF